MPIAIFLRDLGPFIFLQKRLRTLPTLTILLVGIARMISRFYKSDNLISQHFFNIFFWYKNNSHLTASNPHFIYFKLYTGGKSYADTLLEIHPIWGSAELSALPVSRLSCVCVSSTFHNLKIKKIIIK